MESKTTDAYQIDLEPIARYRKDLVAHGEIQQESSSILIVVGRQATDSLEAQVRGSRYAWDIRLISVEALVRLLDVKEAMDDPYVHEQVRDVLVPREYTKVDAIIDLVFRTKEDITTTHHPEGEPPTSENEAQARAASYEEFRAQCLERVQQELGQRLLKRSASLFTSGDGSLAVVCSVSKRYDKGSDFWFAFHPYSREALREAKQGFLVLGCGSPERVLLIPVDDLDPWLEGLNRTDASDRYYWHLSIFLDEGQLVLHPRRGYPRAPLDRFLLPGVGHRPLPGE